MQTWPQHLPEYELERAEMKIRDIPDDKTRHKSC